jgi:hypothetical protein
MESITYDDSRKMQGRTQESYVDSLQSEPLRESVKICAVEAKLACRRCQIVPMPLQCIEHEIAFIDRHGLAESLRPDGDWRRVLC